MKSDNECALSVRQSNITPVLGSQCPHRFGGVDVGNLVFARMNGISLLPWCKRLTVHKLSTETIPNPRYQAETPDPLQKLQY
jgi:hypothetical protein